MRLYTYLAGAFLAGLLLGNPTDVLAGDNYPDFMNRENNAVRETSPSEMFSLKQSVSQRHPAEPFEMASVDYCYRGSIIDPATGEMVDFFVMCTEDEIGHNLDIA
jgi:hypothetical protein